MPLVFVSYRRDDSAGSAGRIYDRLVAEFGEDRVFMDTEGGIPDGSEFPVRIEGALTSASALVVVIGRQWLTCTDKKGNLRIHNDSDWVVNEIATALERDILILPVLVDGASMPEREALPEKIAKLSHKQARDVRASSWRYDLDRIVAALTPVVRVRRWTARRTAALAAACATAAIVVASVASYVSNNPDSVSTPTPSGAETPATAGPPTSGARPPDVSAPDPADERQAPGGRQGTLSKGSESQSAPRDAATPRGGQPAPPQTTDESAEKPATNQPQAVEPPPPVVAQPEPITPQVSPLVSLRERAMAAAAKLNGNDPNHAALAKQALAKAFGLTGNQLISLTPAEAVTRLRTSISTSNDPKRLEAVLQYLP